MTESVQVIMKLQIFVCIKRYIVGFMRLYVLVCVNLCTYVGGGDGICAHVYVLQASTYVRRYVWSSHITRQRKGILHLPLFLMGKNARFYCHLLFVFNALILRLSKVFRIFKISGFEFKHILGQLTISTHQNSLFSRA